MKIQLFANQKNDIAYYYPTIRIRVREITKIKILRVSPWEKKKKKKEKIKQSFVIKVLDKVKVF